MKNAIRITILSFALVLATGSESRADATCASATTPQQKKNCVGRVAQMNKYEAGKASYGQLVQGKRNVAAKRGW